MLKKYHRLTLLLASATLLSACGSKNEAGEENSTTNQEDNKSAVIQTQAFSEIAVPVSHSAPATAKSLNESTLKAEISARIESIPARVGDKVKKGQALVQLNCADAKAQLMQARGQRDAAKARASLAAQQLQRAVQLSEKRSVSEELLSQRKSEDRAAKANAQSAIAAATLANNQTQRCTIRSPFNGIVSERIGQVGELATLGAPMMKVISTDGLEVTADIVPADATSLQQAKAIHFQTPAKSYAVTLRALTAVVGSLSRTQEARLSFVNEQPLPGTPGRLSWSDQRSGIPSQYLTERDGQLGFFVSENNIARFIALPHAQEGRAVATDMNADKLIITLGRSSVTDGQDLNPPEPKPDTIEETAAE